VSPPPLYGPHVLDLLALRQPARGAERAAGLADVLAEHHDARVALQLLAERGYENVRAFASGRSAGSKLPFGDGSLTVEEATPEALGVNIAPRLKLVAIAEPKMREAGIKVDNVATLVEKLKNEAGVL